MGGAEEKGAGSRNGGGAGAALGSEKPPGFHEGPDGKSTDELGFVLPPTVTAGMCPAGKPARKGALRPRKKKAKTQRDQTSGCPNLPDSSYSATTSH